MHLSMQGNSQDAHINNLRAYVVSLPHHRKVVGYLGYWEPDLSNCPIF